MATLVKRPQKAGMGYQVKWRDADTQEWDSEPFPASLDDPYELAKRWKGLIESLGNRRPAPQQQSESAAPAPEKPAVPTLVEECYALVDRLSKDKGYCKRRYRSQIKRHIEPYFKTTPINEVFDDDIQAWQDNRAAGGDPCERHAPVNSAKCHECKAPLSGKTIANIRGSIIAPVYKRACKPRNGKPPLCSFNPVEGVPLPEHRKVRREILATEDDVLLYLRCAYEVDPEAADLLTTGAAMALRWGELAGMPVRDIDQRSHEYRPTQVLARGSEDGDSWHLRPYTKSIAGDERVIEIPASIRPMLYRRCEGKRPDDLVFTAGTGRKATRR